MELNLDSGIQKVTLNCVGSVDVFFNPTDAAFMERLYNAFAKLEKMQNAKKSAENEKQVFYEARKQDAEVRTIIDDLFGDKVADTLFGGVNCFSLVDGTPLWANLLMAIIDQMDDSVRSERAKTEAKISKYTAKYRK